MPNKKWIQDDLAQPHLLEGLDNGLDSLFAQLKRADSNYPGGLANYLSRAKELLRLNAAGANPYDGFQVTVPAFAQPEIGSDEFYQLEKVGLAETQHCGFILVAGGLGERLGYPDIKIGLATNMVTKMTYIEYYFSCIHHLQSRSSSTELPVMIMTSGDTHTKTVALLEANDYFLLKKSQVKIVQQEKVPALFDNEARIAYKDTAEGGREIILKPHGHGDVHTLIYQNNLAKEWLTQKKLKWILFFQDTNAMTFRCLPAFLGVSKTENYHMNSLCIPRTPGEAVGAICKLSNKTTKEEFTLNVEYNSLDALLKGMGLQGDVAQEGKAFSPFPGNCNVLIFNLETYSQILDKTKGVVPEFVNPKYADSTKTTFKAPTRVECMMQEFARLFDSTHNVGATVMPRWFCFSTVKNCIPDAVVKIQKGLPSEGAFSGEMELYEANVKLLKLACEKTGTSLSLPSPKMMTFQQMSLPVGPRIVFMPSYGLSLTELCDRMKEIKSLTISDVNCSLVLDGDISIKSLQLRGDLKIMSRGKLQLGDVVAEGATLSKFEEVDLNDESVPLMERVRGYRLDDSTSSYSKIHV